MTNKTSSVLHFSKGNYKLHSYMPLKKMFYTIFYVKKCFGNIFLRTRNFSKNTPYNSCEVQGGELNNGYF